MNDYLKVATTAVKKAEEIILKYYSDKIRYSLKEDQSPVTIADIESEKIIIGTIKKSFPTHGFLGEESGSSNINSDYLWIIDPIDGTKNYLRKIPNFATLIALMKNGELILGISNVPAFNELLYAQKGKGAYLNDNKISVSKKDTLKDAYLSFGGITQFEESGQTKNFLNLAGSVQESRGFGDAWSYHLLAQGKIEIMIEASTKIWDIAAHTVIIEEAGGKVTDLKGNPIDLNSVSIIATNNLLHSTVLKYLN